MKTTSCQKKQILASVLDTSLRRMWSEGKRLCEVEFHTHALRISYSSILTTLIDLSLSHAPLVTVAVDRLSDLALHCL